MKQQVLYGKTDTLRLTVYSNNRPLIPSSSLITIYKNDGTTEVQSQTSASINGTTGEMTYSLTTTHTAERGLNFKAIWQYVVSGTTYYETQLFDVVRSILSIPITDEDLYAELPSLSKANIQKTGTATATSASSLTDTKKIKEQDNYWKGGVVEIISGTGSGQSRDITASTQSSGVITVSPDFVTTPDATSEYRIIKSWTTAISHNFEKIEQMLYDKGKRQFLILESSQIRVILIYLTLHSIGLDLMDAEGDKWDLLQKKYEEKFKDSFNSLALDYDEDDSGSVQGQEVQQNITSLRIFRS